MASLPPGAAYPKIQKNDEFFIREEMLDLRQRALNRLEEEGMSLFNPADVERLTNEDRYVER